MKLSTGRPAPGGYLRLFSVLAVVSVSETQGTLQPQPGGLGHCWVLAWAWVLEISGLHGRDEQGANLNQDLLLPGATISF